MHAAISGSYDIAKLLIENGADIHEQDKAGDTVLSYCRYYKREAVAKLLKENGMTQ